MNTILLLKLAAVTYLGLLAAGLLMPHVVGLSEHTRTLPKFIRQLIWVYYTFIGIGTFVFDLRPYLTNAWRRAGLFAANLVFTALPFVYGWAALKGPL
jgi:hypothetical protein